MNLKEFVEKINLYAEDIGCMRDGKIGAHNIEARIMVEDTAGNEYSIEDIEVGEELTFDYAMTDASKYDEFECACKKPNCRQKISGSDWQNLELQKKYENYFSSYISKLIKFAHLK